MILGTKNQIIGERWRMLSDEVKEDYKQIAEAIPHPDELTPDSIWRETSRIMKNFEENVGVYAAFKLVIPLYWYGALIQFLSSLTMLSIQALGKLHSSLPITYICY